MVTKILIKTWRCPDCDYTQDFDPNDEELMALHFPGYPVGCCPACHSGQTEKRVKQKVKMVKEARPEKKTTITVKGEDEVDAEVDADEKIDKKDKQAEKNRRKQEIREAIAKFRLLED